MLKHRRSEKRNLHMSIYQFRNKRETRAELTFAKTSATITGDTGGTGGQGGTGGTGDRENIGQ